MLTLAWFGVADHDALALAILVFATTILAPGFVEGVLEACDGCVGSNPLTPRRHRSRSGHVPVSIS